MTVTTDQTLTGAVSIVKTAFIYAQNFIGAETCASQTRRLTKTAKKIVGRRRNWTYGGIEFMTTGVYSVAFFCDEGNKIAPNNLAYEYLTKRMTIS